jgi:hypothetical protein
MFCVQNYSHAEAIVDHFVQKYQYIFAGIINLIVNHFLVKLEISPTH